ncbi:PREDICTED: nuclear pore complex protein Nup153 [Ceratosolen solmsi marchali]|uniref:Nuclear pore complex protein Nup153 n=1 Tax=Ceratosolen solmsi marchali TaxID=326594 RepID=A0AAJ6VP20_9HYME|nr:PREDICTED: nuclear pore complex protein Nup153 [Ceratosolen solmsi marchali]
MAKDNGDGSNSNNLSTPSSSTGTGAKRMAFRSKPYDANNSLVRKVATKMTDLIPHPSWISKWFNSSQDETTLQDTEAESTQYKGYDEEHLHPPPVKRPCIRIDVTHPPGTFNIKPRSRNLDNIVAEQPKENYTNYNETAQDFLEPTTASPRLQRFVSSTPAFSADTNKLPDTRSALNMLMSEQNSNNGAANGMDDNSESSESTSGCSSLIPQNNRQEAPTNANYSSPYGNKRRYIDEKLNFTNHLQSPRSLFLDNTTRETLSSRRPSFNALMMNNSLERSSSLSSPFYPGNTMFGGANAANLYRRSSSVLSEPPQYNLKIPKRTSVEVNPSNSSSTNDLSGMSHTARRILEALEQFSSPLSDAKKMPIRNIMGGSSQISSPTLSHKRLRENETPSPKVGLRHLTRELTVPTVPDLLRIRRRQKLQNTTVNARKIMTSRTAPTPAPIPQDYHIRTEADVEPKRNTQLKAKKKMNLEKQETVESVNLPTMPLPISSLPRFDISLPQCTKPTKPASPNKQQQQQSSVFDKDNYKFASPIRLADSAKNLESINNFTFSKPITPSKMIPTLTMNESYDLSKTLSVDSNDTLSCSSSFTNFIWAGPSQTLKMKEKEKDKEKVVESGGPNVASELKTGSCMDFFAKKPSTSSDSLNTWECNECLIKNNASDKYCMACKSSKPINSSNNAEIAEGGSSKHDSKGSSTSRDNESEKFNAKPANQASLDKIFGNSPFSSASTTTTFNATSTIFSAANTAYQASKTSGNATSTATATTTAVATVTSAIATTTTTSPVAPIMPKLVKSSWECPCCMVRNLENVATCPCCNTAKPGSVNVSPKRASEAVELPTTVATGFGDKFKKPEGSWSCDTCMIQNKTETEKCVACETPRAGAATKPSGFGDMFKKPTGSWTCGSCMLQNKPTADKCAACESAKPGTETPCKSNLQFKVDMPANASSFTFGIDKAAAAAAAAATTTLNTTSTTVTTTAVKTNGFIFQGSSSAPQTAIAESKNFSFGIPSAAKTEAANVPKATNFSPKVSETVAATATFQFGSKPAESKRVEETQQTPVASNFTFGIPSKSSVPSGQFVFGAPSENKAKENKNEAKPSAPTGFLFAPSASLSKDTTSTCDESNKTCESHAPSAFLFNKPTTTVAIPAKEEPPKLEEKPQPSLTEQPTVTFANPVNQQQQQQVQQQPQSLSSFSFGTTSASTTDAAAPPASSTLFSFSDQSKPTTSAPLPTFGSPTAPKPAFSFGKAAETTNNPNTTLQQQPTNKPSTMAAFVGPSPSQSFPAQANSTISSLFGSINATSPTATSNLGATTTKPLMFGASENKVTPPFGETESKLPAFAAPSTSFGSPSNVFGSATATPSFGANATTNIFTTKSSETPAVNPNLFSFGQSSQTQSQSQPQSQSQGSSFNFSAGSSSNSGSTSDQKNIFSFGASSGSGQAGNGFRSSGNFSATTPSFSFSATPKPEAASASPGFGQTTSAPIFNAVPTAQSSTYPAPANPALNSATPFSFGATNFNFGACESLSKHGIISKAFITETIVLTKLLCVCLQSPAPVSSGFNFNAPSNSSTPVAFDPNVQPTFNFTAGSAPTVFTAPPARKIKKAVRRMPRQ